MKIKPYLRRNALFLVHHRHYKLKKKSKLLGWSEHDVLIHVCGAYILKEPITVKLYSEFIFILRKNSMLPMAT